MHTDKNYKRDGRKYSQYLACVFVRKKCFPTFICHIITTDKLYFFWLYLMMDVLILSQKHYSDFKILKF